MKNHILHFTKGMFTERLQFTHHENDFENSFTGLLDCSTNYKGWNKAYQKDQKFNLNAKSNCLSLRHRIASLRTTVQV